MSLPLFAQKMHGPAKTISSKYLLYIQITGKTDGLK